MARILVTGASGFIGTHVARRLAAAGHRVLATGRDESRLVAACPGIPVRVADLACDDLHPLVQDCDIVVHCAALSSPWGRAEDFWQSNVMATERLLGAMGHGPAARFIHLGSPSIYFRYRDQFRVPEAFIPPKHWITEYARSKWESECRVRAASRPGLQTIILRPRAVFGEGDRAILPRLLAVAAHGWFPLINNGRALIDITHIDNLVDLVTHCVDADLPADGRAYNVSNGEPIRVRDLLTELFHQIGLDVQLVGLPRAPMLALAGLCERMARIRPGMPEPRLTCYGIGVIGYSQTLDISRAERELDYRPQTGLQTQLARFARWWKANDHT